MLISINLTHAFIFPQRDDDDGACTVPSSHPDGNSPVIGAKQSALNHPTLIGSTVS